MRDVFIMASKKTTVVSGRIPYDLKKQMQRENLTVRDCIEIAINVKKNPKKEYEAELKSLLSESELLASKIAFNNIRIEEIKSEIGFTGNDDDLKKELFVSETDQCLQITLDHYNSWKGTSKLSILDFIYSERGSKIIDKQLLKLDIAKEDFIIMLMDKADGSIQTTLDS